MELDRQGSGPAEAQEIDKQASILMEEGIRLMNGAGPEAISAALRCFDGALELRRRLPAETSPRLGYDLAACWLNRADALMCVGTAESSQLALGSYDEALVLLRDLPLHEDPLFPRRLAIAHQNRGLALLSPSNFAIAESRQEFSEAIEILEHEHAAAIADRLYLLAAAWVNLAHVELVEGTAQSEKRAEGAARRGIALVEGLEGVDVRVAEIGMKARHVFCQMIARRLSQITGTLTSMPSEVHDATDAADDGLALARLWEQKGVDRFRKIACDLFRFGMRVYATYQPQFLPEFVSENMDPARSSPSYVESEEMRSAASELSGLVRI